MAGAPGVYLNQQKNGKTTYRASFTYNSKHISLGTYDSEKAAGDAYDFALRLMDSSLSISDYSENTPILFEKYVILCNLRDNRIYISNPIYLDKRYFSYYYSENTVYIFDMDDLFYFSSHKLMKRGNHLFVSDYGLQVSLNEHFGIRPFSVPGRDFIFINGDSHDYRRENIEIINRFYGVLKETKKTTVFYKTVIHVNGNIIVGRYESEIEAAIAYNKAADILKSSGVQKDFPQNYIEGLSPRQYAEIYTAVSISPKISTAGNNPQKKD